MVRTAQPTASRGVDSKLQALVYDIGERCRKAMLGVCVDSSIACATGPINPQSVDSVQPSPDGQFYRLYSYVVDGKRLRGFHPWRPVVRCRLPSICDEFEFNPHRETQWRSSQTRHQEEDGIRDLWRSRGLEMCIRDRDCPFSVAMGFLLSLQQTVDVTNIRTLFELATQFPQEYERMGYIIKIPIPQVTTPPWETTAK